MAVVVPLRGFLGVGEGRGAGCVARAILPPSCDADSGNKAGSEEVSEFPDRVPLAEPGDGCGDGVAAERLCRAAVLEMASLKQPMHAVVVLGEMAANACCRPASRLAIGSLPTAPQTHLLDILRFYELYVKTGQGRVRNRKVRYPMVE